MININSIKKIVEDHDTFAGKAFDVVIQILIIISLISFTIETLPDISVTSTHVLNNLEIVIVTIFTIEYILRVIVADRKMGYIFSVYGLIDLIAILPFYLSTSIDLRSLRIIRLLRLFRLFKLVRYNKAIRRFIRAFQISKEVIILFFIVACLLLYFASVGIYYFEHDSQPDNFKSYSIACGGPSQH